MRASLRARFLILSIAVPIGFVAFADHVRQSTGISALGLGGLVAFSFVLATTMIASHR
jgi:hypothetical protein